MPQRQRWASSLYLLMLLLRMIEHHYRPRRGSWHRGTRSGKRALLIYPALISLGANMLAACAGQWPSAPSRTSGMRPVAWAPSSPVARPARKPKPPAATDTSLPQAGELIGLDQPEATHLLGTAAEQFVKPPAAVWRYKSATCELDLFFYLDLRSNRLRTLHYTVKGDGGDPTRRQDCWESLRVARSN